MVSSLDPAAGHGKGGALRDTFSPHGGRDLEKNSTTLQEPWLSAWPRAYFVVSVVQQKHIISDSFITWSPGMGEDSLRWPSRCAQPAVMPPAGPRVSVQRATRSKDGETRPVRGPGAKAKEHSFLVSTFFLFGKYFCLCAFPSPLHFYKLRCNAERQWL